MRKPCSRRAATPEVMRYWDWPAQPSAAAVREVLAAHMPEPGDQTML
jgi:hypothetical protein